MAEGLSGLVVGVDKISLYSEFKVCLSNLMVNHLQHANNSLLVADHTLENR